MDVYCYGISGVLAAIIESRANRMRETMNMVVREHTNGVMKVTILE